jgi:sugar (glycoside-pentoside-hexuronide) transporter
MSAWARIRFALGDFAFNLLWQSVSLYLLYYYTDVLGVRVEIAALLYMAGSIWEGVADLAVGGLIDRLGQRGVPCRRWLIVGSVPLCLAFVLVYAAPVIVGRSAAILLSVQILFRTAYTATNLPYAALTARITQDSRDRAAIAGLRMGFGALAAALVAFGTGPLGTLATGQVDSARGFLAAALLLAVAAGAVLLPVALAIRERAPPVGGEPHAFARTLWRSLIGNTALMGLNAAMAAAIVAMTLTTKSVLYYFKYALGDAAAGQQALGLLGIVGGVAIPVWMRIGRSIGGRNVWLAACALGVLAVAAYAATPGADARTAQLFLCAMQTGFVGLNYAFWSLLPDTIEYGERATGLRMEGTAFGAAALLQKLALAGATGGFGLALGAIGYRANAVQHPGTLAGMRTILLAGPAIALLVSAACIAANPLRRGTHARIVAELGAG